jgi:hypothetical protein
MTNCEGGVVGLLGSGFSHILGAIDTAGGADSFVRLSRYIRLLGNTGFVKISQVAEIVRYHLDVSSSNASVLSPVSMVFFVRHLLGIRTEALRAPVIYLTHESVTAGAAFHFVFAASSDIILGIVAQ